jgi:hypothetical protein
VCVVMGLGLDVVVELDVMVIWDMLLVIYLRMMTGCVDHCVPTQSSLELRNLHQQSLKIMK